MTSVRHRPPSRLRAAVLALAAFALPAVLLTNLHGKAAADSPALRSAGAASTAGHLTLPLSVDWKFTGNYFGSNPAAPVITEDTAYIICGNAVYALSLANGSQKWRYPEDPTATMQKLCVFTPALGNGMLYIGSPDGLYALSTTDGKLQWRFNPSGKSEIITSPIVIGNNVYFAAQNDRIYGLNGKTGDLLSGVYKGVGNHPPGVDMGGDLGAEPTIVGDDMFYATTNQELHDFDLTTGVMKWSTHFNADVSTATPIFFGDSFYLAAGSTYYNFRASNGQVRWFIQLPTDVAVPPAVDADGNSYIITSDLNIYAINSVHRPLWSKAAHLDYRPTTRPIVTGNLLIIPTALGGLTVLDTATGNLKWDYVMQPASQNPTSIPVGTNIAALPVVQGDTLYTLSDDGSLTAFRHDAVDTEPPTISDLVPENGAYLNGRPPFHISAKIMDEGSGLDLSTLEMKLDDQPLRRKAADKVSTSPADNGFYYNRETSMVEFNTIDNDTGKTATLADGHHTATVIVKDWKGNTLAKTWTFYTDDTIKPKLKSTQPGGQSGRPGFPGGPSGPGGLGPGGKL